MSTHACHSSDRTARIDLIILGVIFLSQPDDLDQPSYSVQLDPSLLSIPSSDPFEAGHAAHPIDDLFSSFDG